MITNGTTHPQYRLAPAGFTPEQWETFNRDGVIIIENALTDDEVEHLLDAVDRVAQNHPKYEPGSYLSVQNFVERDPILASLIDHDRHIGFPYDLYGEQLKLQLSELFLRTPHGGHNNLWHPDGARALPYGVFSPALPLQMKVGYWLTDLPQPKMGNFVYMPGSHRQQYFEGYDTHESAPGEKILCVPKGTMTIMHGSIWHRVEPNESNVTRKNLFLAYCPSWITSADRLTSDPDWLQSLNREQRIIMRSYSHAYANAKPPAEDFPLFLDRETGLDHDPDMYSDHVRLFRRKRKTAQEKWQERMPS
ncbi:MAG: phytanoyl-CoA dioxygenase family protein [Chloroflexota bacterium]